MKPKIILFIVLLILIFSIDRFNCFAQQGVSINNTGNSSDSSAIFDISSTSKGLLIPRVALKSIYDVVTIPSPAASLLVYNTNYAMSNGAIGFWYFNGTIWEQISGFQGPSVPTGTSSCNGTVYNYNQGTPYTYSNSSGNYENIYIKAWGGGGGGNGNSTMSCGGGAGYAYAMVILSDGESLTIRPGGGGEIGGGGGASIVVRHTSYWGDKTIAIAAGGGGGGADGGSSGPVNANGGAGGGLVGQAGTGQSFGQNQANGGAGGTQSNGGAGGTAVATGQSACNGSSGASLVGGNTTSSLGCSNTYNGSNQDIPGTGGGNGNGGSGGAGYFGGGGGGSVWTYIGGGGGGGSSYSNVWPYAFYGQTVGGNGQIAGLMQDPCNQGAGLGGNPGEPGRNGIVVLIKQ